MWLKKRSIEKWKFYRAFYDYLLFAEEKICSERMPRGEIDASFKSDSKEFLAVLKGENAKLSLKDQELSSIKEYL